MYSQGGLLFAGVVSLSRLQRQLLTAAQSDSQVVKAAVQLLVLRRETEHVVLLGGLGYASETGWEVVAVLKRRATRRVRQGRQNLRFGRCALAAILQVRRRRLSD
jgi:hypothetical protein